MKESNTQKELSRVPRTLSESSNTKVLEVLFDAGGTVMSDIIIYVASSQMKDLFGDCWFSINDFCEVMGYERTKLQRKLTEKQLDFLFSNQRPVYITEQNGQKIEHPIENTFEAALYRLGTSNLSVAYAMNGKTQYKFIQILDRFEIKDNFGTKKRTKRNYNVHLSKDLMNTLLTEYNLLELKDYRNLPNRKGYRKFYLNLAKMIYLIKYKIDQGQAPYFTVTVDQLAKEFDVTVKDNHDRKKKVTSILNGINKKLERTKFQYQYIKGKGEKWPYTAQFFFDQETLEYFDEKIKAILTSQYHGALKSCFLLNKKGIPVSRHYQYKDFFKLGTGEYYHEFTAWLYSEEDKEIKENIYRDIYIKVVGIRPEDLAVNLNP